MTVQALRPLYEIETRLQDIKTANGYNTDAGNSVFLGRSLVSVSSIPAVSVVPGEDEGEVNVSASLYQETVSYEIHGICQADPDRPFEKGHQLAADIRRAIYRAKTIDFEQLNDTAMTVTPGGTTVSEAEPGSGICEVSVALSITYTERLGEPDEPE